MLSVSTTCGALETLGQEANVGGLDAEGILFSAFCPAEPKGKTRSMKGIHHLLFRSKLESNQPTFSNLPNTI